MSFGGGSQYTLEYLVKVTNQGGTTGLSQINTGLKQVDMSLKQTSLSAQQLDAKLEAAKNKMNQAVQTQTKALKGLAFGILGATTAGAEFAGMWGMHVQVSEAVKEAQGEVNQAIAEYGEESSEAKKATQELTQAKRWESMVNRNLMLSTFDIIPFIVLTINGMVKEKNAIKELGLAKQELKTVNDLMTKSNAGLAASNKVVDASMVSATKGAKTFTVANKALAASNLSTNGSLITSIPLLSKQTAGLDSTTKAAGRATKAMRVLSIAMKIALPLIALEIGAQAYDKNWGGFRDRINEVGKAIGDSIPAMRGFLDIVGKVGESVVAIFTGDWESIGSIWSGASKGVEQFGKRTEAAEKKLEELREKVSEFQEVGTQLLVDVSQGDKKDQRNLLKSLGIKGDEKEKMRDVLDAVEDAYNETQQAASKLEALEGFSILEKLGFDIPEDVIKDIQNTLDSDLRDVLSGDNDPFNKLADILEDSPNKETYGETLKKWVTENPGLMEALKKFDPKLAAAIESYIANVEVTAQAELDKMLLKFPDTVIDIDPNTDVGEDVMNKLDTRNARKKNKKPGILGSIVSQIEEAVKGLPAQIQAIDWSAVGKALRESFLSIVAFFKLDDPAYLGSILRANVIDPIFVAVGEALRPAIAEFKKDPIGFTIGVLDKATAWIGNFVAGIFGYPSEEQMFNDVDDKINAIFAANPFISTLRSLVQDPIGSLINILTGHSVAGLESVDISKHSLGPEVKKALGIKSKGAAGDMLDEIWEKSGMREFVDNLPTLDDIKNKILENEGVKILIQAYDAISGSADKFIKWAMSIVNTANAADEVVFSGSSRFTNAMSPSEAITKRSFDVPIPNVNVIPGDITIQNPPTTNTTPTKPMVVTPSSLTLQPQNLIYDLSTAGTTIPKESVRIHDAVVAVFEDMVKLINNQFEHMANVFSVVANSLGSNAKSGADQVYKALRKTFDKVINDMSELASHWSRMMNSLGANARSAAKQVNKALDSIEDEEVVITYKTVGEPKAKGGIMSFANGGVMSAATGKLLTTYGPRLFQIGDNPGGRESIWAIPHNSPGRIVRQINKMYGSGAQSGGTTVFNGQVNLKIDGNSIINDIKLNRRVQLVMGDDMDRYGP